ncbi:MAG: hypothetical protein VR73_01120 [Gammaproteobacteria bacterium BRH_c0]|nr:MAG: hypothetical protein VR73_01120 [Gammaproteobacteria bacterium BRH_c0]
MNLITSASDSTLIRAARPDDIPAIARLDAKSTAFPWCEQQFSESLASHRLYVLEIDGVVSGYLVYSLVLDEAELLNIAIAPRLRRRGHGARLLEYFIEANRGVANRLLLEVRHSNRSAIDLYNSHGFVKQGVRKGYYPTSYGREDAWMMVYEY